MARKLRVEYEAVIYHMMNRGDRREGDRRKVKIARRLRQETTMTLKWIADRLKMGTWTHVSNQLYHAKK